MKLRTSFFNFRVLLKNLTRFAPLWVLYAVGEVLGLMTLDLESRADQIAHALTNIMGGVSAFHLVYALLVAACLFGDLFDSRMCNGIHAMPMKREGWLLTNLVSGLLFALIPAIAGGGVAMLFLGKYWWVALIWQGTSLLQFLFFFGLAVFCAMCTGKRLGMIAMYGILNFLSLLVFWIADSIYEPLLTGVVLSDYWFAKLCPVVSFAGSVYLDCNYDNILGWFFRGFFAEEFGYLFICAGVGVVFTLLAWVLYRKRPLEKAGDFVVFRPMGVFFLLSYTLVLGVLLYSFGDYLGLYKDYGFLVVGLLIGWFTGWMLLERTVKIFTKKVWLGLLAFLVLFSGSMVLTVMDPVGVTTYIPETHEIASANLYMQGDVYYYESGQEDGWQITDPEEIARVQKLHTSMIEDTVCQPDTNGGTYALHRLQYRLFGIDAVKNGPDYETLTINIRYQLRNGNVVYRNYRISAEGQIMEDLRQFFSDPRAMLNVSDWAQVKSTLKEVVLYQHDKDGYTEIYTDSQKQALLAAIEADCRAGNMVQHGLFHKDQNTVAGIDLAWDAISKVGDIGTISYTRGYHVVVYGDCVNTLACMETLLKK